MALSTAQIISIATQIANVPGFTAQALQLLNAVLQELDQDYDFQTIRKSFNFNFSTTVSGLGYAPGSGPNPMPADFLRLHRNGSFYQIFQVPYKLIGVTQEEFDTFVQQPGLASYPYLVYVDVASTPMGLFVWPPASGNYPATVRYNPIMPDITFDPNMQAYLSDEPGSGGSGDMLRKYLTMKDDPVTAPKTVSLDRRMFKSPIATLRNTKTIGW